MRSRAVRGGSEGRARRPKACRSSGSAIAAEVLMNDLLSHRHTCASSLPERLKGHKPIALRQLWFVRIFYFLAQRGSAL